MKIFKPAKIQYSCTCLQYDIDFDKIPQVLEMAKELGFTVKPHNIEGCARKGHILKRAIEADLTMYSSTDEDMSLEYSDEIDVYHVPNDFQRALDCLRLSYIGADHSSGSNFNFGEPAPVLSTDLDFSQQVQEQEKKVSIYLPETPWLFASITNKCNLNCKFCYSKKGEEDMQPDKLKEALGKVREISNEHVERYNKKGIKCEPRPVGVTMGGGEPTLHPELEKIIETAKNNAEMVTLTTNGTNNKRLIALADYLDGICISAPFIYTDKLNDYCALSNEKIKKYASELAQKFKKLCLATIITNKMQPEDVFKVDEIAAELGATNTLFLLYKPIQNNELMPTKKQARKILEKILELAFQKHNTAIDCCLAKYTAGCGCGFHYMKTDGILRKSGWEKECECPFSKEHDCLIKYIYV